MQTTKFIAVIALVGVANATATDGALRGRQLQSSWHTPNTGQYNYDSSTYARTNQQRSNDYAGGASYSNGGINTRDGSVLPKYLSDRGWSRKLGNRELLGYIRPVHRSRSGCYNTANGGRVCQ
jgi:hypothetical protein